MSSDEVRAQESTPLLREIQDDFEAELRRQGSDKTVWSLLKDNPAAMVLILALFGLVVVVGRSFSGLDPAQFVDAVDYRLLAVQLLEMDESIATQVSVATRIDYSKAPSSAWLGEWAGGVLGTVTVQLATPMDVSVVNRVPAGHVVSVEVPDKFSLDVANLGESTINVTCSVSDVGRPDVLQGIAQDAIAGKEIMFALSTVVRLSKWGFEFSVPLRVELPFQVENPGDNVGELVQIDVGRRHDNVLEGQVTSRVDFAGIVAATIPSLNWSLKLPGCDGDPVALVTDAISHPIELVDGEEAFNVTMDAVLETLPAALTEACSADGGKSALDKWLSRYLDGEPNVIYVQGSSGIPVLHQLLHGYDLRLAISGKPLDEKLVEQVAVDSVEIAYENLNEVLITANVVVMVTVPGIVHMKRDLLVALNEVRGPIYLYDDNVRMGVIYIDEWTPTVTVPQEDGFQITLFLDRAPIEVENPSEFAKFSRTLLLKGHAPLEFQTMLDLSIQSPIGDMLLLGMFFQGRTEVYK